MPYCFSRSSVKFQGHTALEIVEFDPDWAFPDCNSSLNSPMAPKWSTKLEVELKRCPIVFQGHTSNCKVTRLKKSSILTQIGRFRTVTPVWNSPMATKWCKKLEVALNRCHVVFRGHTSKFQGHTALKIIEFDPDWAFPDWNSSLISPMAPKWCTKLEVALKRCSIVFFWSSVKFHGHTALKKSSNLPQIGRFRTHTQVWIHQWLRNDAQSLT